MIITCIIKLIQFAEFTLVGLVHYHFILYTLFWTLFPRVPVTQWQITQSPSATLWQSPCKQRWAPWRRSPAEAVLPPPQSNTYPSATSTRWGNILRYGILQDLNKGGEETRTRTWVDLRAALCSVTTPLTEALMRMKELSAGLISAFCHPAVGGWPLPCQTRSGVWASTCTHTKSVTGWDSYL